jgi:hypothetical protein
MHITSTTRNASLIGLCVFAAWIAGDARAEGLDRLLDHAEALDSTEGAAPSAEKCVHVTTRTPYRGFGYDHEVDIENACAKPQVCKVKSNVNPDVQEVKVAVGKTATVVTFRGSPAREFKAEVDCKADGSADAKPAG